MGCFTASFSWAAPPKSISSAIASARLSSGRMVPRGSSSDNATTPPKTSVSYTHRWYNPMSSTRPDSTPEIVRKWVEAETHSSLPAEGRVIVVSYNILGDRNAWKHWDMYRNVSSVYLQWEYRKRLLCEELVDLNPDIICLQEVDKYYDILHHMEKAGYAGSYKRRTGTYADGCAMFWKANKFRLLDTECIEFKQFGLRDNVAQLSAFEMSETESSRLIVGNIHVLYRPSRGEIKLGQIRHLSSRAKVLSEKWGNVPVVLAGDFNSTPESAIYTFLSSSKLDVMMHDRRELSGQGRQDPTQVLGLKREKNVLFVLMRRFLKSSWTSEEILVAGGNEGSQTIEHPLKLRSSYAVIKGSTGTRGNLDEPVATSYHSKFLGTVDYLWYTDGLEPTRVLDTLSIDILKRTGGLPCKKLGSDHLALVSEFAIIQGNNQKLEREAM